MKKLVLSVIIVVLSSGAFAAGLGTDITIFDKVNCGTTGWNGVQEDQEVEPGNSTGQSWDLEGFFLDGNVLNMVGGYDFVNGNGGVMSGDLFIDVDGDATYGTDTLPRTGNGYKNSEFDYGFDYVLDFDFEHMTYKVIDLSGTDKWLSVYYGNNDESNPYRYVSGGTQVGSGTIGYQTGLTNAQTGLLGDAASSDGGDGHDGHDGHDGGDDHNGGGTTTTGSHNLVSLDLFDNTGWDLDSYLADGLLFHFTMGCGNDNLMGRINATPDSDPVPVPEPASLALMGLGVGGLLIRTRRSRIV